VAIPLGFAAGAAARTVLQGIALGWRIRHAPMPARRPDDDEALADPGNRLDDVA